MAKLPTRKNEPDYLLALKKALGIESDESFSSMWTDLVTSDQLAAQRLYVLQLLEGLSTKQQQPVEEKQQRVTPVWFQDTLQVQDLTDSEIVDCILETSIAFVPIADQQGELAFIAGIEND